MLKRKLFAVFFLIIFSFSVFTIPEGIHFPDEQQQTDPSEQIDEDFIHFTSLLPKSEIPSEKTLDTETWYLGESVNTTIEFNKHILNYFYIVERWCFDSTYAEPYSRYSDNEEFIDSDDTSSGESYKFTVEDAVDGFYYYLDLKIYAGGVGILYTQEHQLILTTNDGANIDISTDAIRETSFDSLMMDAEGYIHIRLRFVFTISSSILASLGLTLLYNNLITGGYTIIDSQSVIYDGTGITCLVGFAWWYDVFYFQRDTIINNIRSEHQYVSATQLIHSLEIPSVPHAKKINISYSNDWTYSSINPYASISDSSYILTVNCPTELTYTVLFTSSTDNHLPLKDISDYYLLDKGFENNNYDGDWTNDITQPFETLALDTEFVYDGYFSLNATQSSGTSGIINMNVTDGIYYITASVYIESISGGDEEVFLGWYNGSWHEEHFDTSIINSWQSITFLCNISNNDWDLRLTVTATTSVIYFDYSSLIFMHSAEVESLSSTNQRISVDYINLDGRKNFPSKLLYVTIELYNLDESELITNITTHTDEYGRVEWTFNTVFEEAEYAIYSYVEDIQVIPQFSMRFIIEKVTTAEGKIKFNVYPVFPVPPRLQSTWTMRPSGAGTYTQNVKYGDTANYLCVDDVSPDDASTYVWYDMASYVIDTYALPDHTTQGGIISSVNVYIRTRYTGDSGDARIYIRTESTNYYQETAVTTSWDTDNYIWTQNPKTSSAWTWAQIDALEIGVALKGNLFPPGKGQCTQVYAVVTYISDTTDPDISSPADQEVELGSTGNSITWTVSDDNPNDYIIYRNSSNVESGSWTSGTLDADSGECDGLAVGFYSFILWVDDDFGNDAQDEVIFQVSDTTAPIVDAPSNIGYELGSTSNLITWTATDLSPDTWSVTKDGSPYDSGQWTSGVGIDVDIDGLDVNVYSFVITVEDDYGHIDQDTVQVTVSDTTNPNVNSPSDDTYELGSSSNTIVWTATDLDADTWTVYLDSSPYDSGSWTSGVGIVVNIDGLSVGVGYSFVITVYDVTGNYDTDTVLITVEDTTNPQINHPSDDSYELGSSNNEISWTATDLDADNWAVTKNGSAFDSGYWTSGVAIVLDIDGLPVGVWEMIITVYDSTGNYVTDTVYITVVDTTNPQITNPADDTYELGSSSNQISWTGTDLDADNYIIYRNTSNIASGSWTTSVPINLGIDGLSVGIYNFTIIIFDSSGNYITDTVWITVEDTTNPDITNPSDDTIELGSNGNEISWTATDLDSNNYIIYRNNTNVQSSTWTTSVPIIIDIDGLSVGIYNFTIIVWDNSGNYIIDTVWITVEDSTNPEINNPADDTYELGSNNNEISWTGTDLSPNNYIIYRNTTNIASGSWTSGNPINLDIDGLSVGIYNFTIIIYDDFGNYITDTVWITVEDTTNPEITSPNDDSYEEDSTSNTISWTGTDLSPDNYIVYRNGTEHASGSWSDSVPININIDGLGIGIWNFTIIIYDDYNNYIKDIVWITVTDTVNPEITSPSDDSYAEGSNNNEISWTGTDNNPDTFMVWKNGTEWDSGSWSSGTPIVVDIDGLTVGIYNFTIRIVDDSGNYIIDLVWITVFDDTNPEIDNPSDDNYQETETGTTITWIATDTYPDTYIIYRNGTDVQSDTWTSGIGIQINVDGLAVGVYNFTIICYDDSGNYVIDLVWITVNTNEAPIISNIGNDPITPYNNETIDISCDVVDVTGLDTVLLYYRYSYESEWSWVEMTNGGTFDVTVESFNGFALIQYYIWANDTTGLSSTSSIYDFSVRLVSFLVYRFEPTPIEETPTLNVYDTSFYLSSENNTNSYEIYFDGKYLGIYTDLQTILKNNTIGDHNLTYIVFSAGEILPYISSSYEYLYSMDEGAFFVSVTSFYITDSYVSTYVISNYDGTYNVYEDGGEPIESGTLYAMGTTIITNRDTTVGASINYTIAFTSSSEKVVFQVYYTNPSIDFFITECYIDIDTTITVTWDTSRSDTDSLTVYENDVLKVNAEATSPSDWTKATVAGTYFVALTFSATDYNDIVYSFVYEVAEIDDFTVNVESFGLSDSYINTYITSNYDGTYSVFQDNSPDGDGNFYATGTFISSARDMTAGSTINYSISFTYDGDTVWFNTSYSNPTSSFYVESCSIEESAGDYVITWDTTKDAIDSLSITEDGVLVVDTATTSPSDWPKSTVAGTHYVILIFSAAGYENIILSYVYTVLAQADFTVSVESFSLSDSYVNLYVTSNYDGNWYVFQDNDPDGDGVLSAIGTVISSVRDTSAGATIDYAVKFVNSSTTIWFNCTYSNAVAPFYIESCSIEESAGDYVITWDTTKDSIDFLNVYEDGALVVNTDYTSPSDWPKSTVIGVHYVTLIFGATNYENIILSFVYEVVSAIFEINIESFYLSELYVSTHITASENGNYQVYENNTAIPSESPTPFYSIGTSIQTDRNLTEGAFINYAIKFWNAAEDVIWFNTTYSNTEGDFFVTDYSVNIADTTVTVTWATSLPDSDSLTVKEDGANKVTDDETSPSDWVKSTVVGTHTVTLLFEASGYTTVTYSFNYHIYAVEDFQVDVSSFQISDTHIYTYASSNYDGNWYVYEDNEPKDSGLFYGAGTTIITSRNTTSGISIEYSIKFVYDGTSIWFNTSYTNPVTPFYLTDYRVDEDSTITITWATTLSALDSLTVYEDGVIKVNEDIDSTSSWTRSTIEGNHFVTLIFSATDYDDIIHSFSYAIAETDVFSVSVESFGLSDSYINTYVTANYDGTYSSYQDNEFDGSGSFYATGTFISSARDMTAGTTINYSISFTYDGDVIWFNTSYSNPTSSFYVESCSIEESAEDYVITWDTTKDAIDSLSITEDGSLVVNADTTSTSSWTKSTVAGTHYVILIFSAAGYDNIFLSFVYTVDTEDFFSVSVESFGLSDEHVNTYITSSRNGTFYVYEDNFEIYTDSFYGIGTTIETSRNTTEGVTIAYSIKFVNDSTIWFNATYTNPVTAFYLTDYRVDELSTITVTWATTIPSLDNLTVYEDGVLKVNQDTASPSSWTRSTVEGNHYVTLIFAAHGYDDIIHSFSYTIYATTAFMVNVHTFVPSDDYFNLYCTSNYDYTYESFTNGTPAGSGSGMMEGTYIIVPKTKEAGLFNLTIVFTYNAETVIFMTWYSNLIPPLHPLNNLERDQSDGYYNISLYTNLDSYWIDVYHDDSLIIDDSTEMYFSILKDTLVGWHNITLLFIYNCSTDSEGYPVAEYNISIPYYFSYDVVFFYDVRIRYVPEEIGLMIGEFQVGWVNSYLDGELILCGDISNIEKYSNYTFITTYDIRIHNTIALHNLVVTDLFDVTILDITIDISDFTYRIIELPIFRLGVINLDEENHRLAIRPYPWRDSDSWQYTPILATGLFVEFWFHEGSYIFAVFSSTTYIADGVETTVWYEDDLFYLPPGELPIVIKIPMLLEGPVETTTTTETHFSVIPITMLLGLIFIISIYKRKLKGKTK